MSFIGKSTTFLDFGAVKINPFPKPVPCTSNAVFCQPTEQTDDIEFQFEVSESTELIANGTFEPPAPLSPPSWTLVGWQFAINQFGSSSAQQTAGVNALSQKGVLTVNDFYKVTLSVSNYPGGTLIVGGGTGSVMFNAAMAIQSNGTFTAFFQYNEGGGAGDFIIQGSAASSVGVFVDNVSVIKISDTSDYDIEILNQETDALIDTVPAANMRLSDNILTVAFNWLEDVSVTNGCRVIQVIDNTNLFEDTFNDNQGWTVTSDIVFTGTEMRYTSTGINGRAFIDNVFIVGETYEITIITTAQSGDGALFIKCGSTIGTIRSSNGTFIEELTCTNNGRLEISFSGGAAATIAADNLVIKKIDSIAGRSECYDLQTSHDCSLLFKWSNNESWGGFDYSTPAIGNAFIQKLRVEAKFRGPKYPSTKNIGEDSAGLKTLDYTSFRKEPGLDINFAPEYIHDAIAAMFMQDVRTIEDISYVLVDEYEPSPPNDSVVLFKDLMTARLELEKSDQPNQINRTV